MTMTIPIARIAEGAERCRMTATAIVIAIVTAIATIATGIAALGGFRVQTASPLATSDVRLETEETRSLRPSHGTTVTPMVTSLGSRTLAAGAISIQLDTDGTAQPIVVTTVDMARAPGTRTLIATRSEMVTPPGYRDGERGARGRNDRGTIRWPWLF